MENSTKDSIKVHFPLAAILLILLIIPTALACQESWQCFGWQKCFDNITTRACFDINNCGTASLNPSTSESCSAIFQSCYDGIISNDETDVDCGGNSCTQCSDNQICLQNSDCLSLYCSSGKCAEIQPIGQPAPILQLSPYYAYGLWLLLLISLFIVIFLIIQANRFIQANYPEENEFNIDLSSYLNKRVKPGRLDEEIEFESEIPKQEEEKIKKKLEKLEEKQKKNEKKWLEIDGIKVSLPPKETRQKEAYKPGPSEIKKRQILKDIKAIYEYSYE